MPRATKPRATRSVHRSARLDAPSGRALTVVVVADTHSYPHARSLELIQEHKPDAILHAGDIGDLEVLAPLEALAPLHAVRGNIDGRQPGLADSIDLQIRFGGELAVTLLLMHIALYGPKLRRDAAALAGQHGATLVVCGHSHVPFIGLDRGLEVFNPGSIGPRRFQLPITFGVIEVSLGSMRARHVSCETGRDWSPGTGP